MAIDQHDAGRACIFCGSRPLNREHLLSDWLRDVLPSEDQAVHFRQTGHDELEPWERKPFREKTRFVCEPCNGGWMSALESAARRVLEQAIRYEPCVFNESDQATAAAWAFKTCLVFQATQHAAGPIAPPSHFLSIRRDRRPPPQVGIWIGSHHRVREDPINSVYLQHPLALEGSDGESREARPFGYLCFLAIGGLSFVVVGHRDGGRAQIGYEGPFLDPSDQIWPEPSRALTWPPRYMMDRDLVQALTLSPSGFTIRALDA